MRATTAVCLNDDGQPFAQYITKAKAAKDDDVGTCIHNILAAYDPEAPRSDMVALAAATIERHALKDVLTSPDAVISSMETLCDILAKTYGKAGREYVKELAVRLIRICGSENRV